MQVSNVKSEANLKSLVAILKATLKSFMSSLDPLPHLTAEGHSIM